MANEKRLINADALIQRMKEEDKLSPGVPWSITAVQRQIEKMPAVDAVPVVHGRWMLESETMNCNGGYTHYCDHCEDYYTTEANSLYFCPRCGAKMIEIEQPRKEGWTMDFVDGEWKRVRGVINERFIETRTEADFPNCGSKMGGK